MNKLDQNTGLVLNNYKEPLKKVENGFGYYGAVLLTLNGEKIQCHICGRLFNSVGAHLKDAHKINAVEYKNKFQLAQGTALISEKLRNVLKEQRLAYYHSGLRYKFTAEQRQRSKEILIENNKKRKGWKMPLEIKNKYGTCPEQTLAKISECKEKIGYVPSRIEFQNFCGGQRYLHLAKTHFGSWTNALKKISLNNKPFKRGQVQKRSDEELLKSLKDFWEITKKIPTESESRRGNLPYGDLYRRRFGGWIKARELAGVPHPSVGHPTWIKEKELAI